MKKYFFLLAALSLSSFAAFTQSIAINDDGSLANPHAIVDIKSSNKGVLIPRMSTAARVAIPNTRGLLVFDTTTNWLWYNTGVAWQTLGANAVSGNAWLLTGNNNTQDRVNFLGTINNVPLNIMVNNQASGRIDPARNNTYWGYQAGSSDTITTNYPVLGNTAVGSMALFANMKSSYNTAFGLQTLFSNTIGWFNTANGAFALSSNTTGEDNTASGVYALTSNTTGTYNTATGLYALKSNISGNNNTGNGAVALAFSTTGSDNTADGYEALYFNTTGNSNTADGSYALANNLTGEANTAIGNYALITNKTGSYNTAAGLYALVSNYSGDNLTALGTRADVSVDGLNNATAIGYTAVVNASNKVRIGNTNVTVIEGQVPFTTPSDGRFKFNIQENVKGLDFIMKLRPVTYQFDVKKQDDFTRGLIKPEQLGTYITSAGTDEATQMIRTGFIAQEVEQAAKKSGYDFDGVKAPKTEKEYYSLSYSSFVVPLVKAVQEQQEIINTQQRKMAEQDNRINNLEQELVEIKKLVRPSH